MLKTVILDKVGNTMIMLEVYSTLLSMCASVNCLRCALPAGADSISRRRRVRHASTVAENDSRRLQNIDEGLQGKLLTCEAHSGFSGAHGAPGKSGNQSLCANRAIYKRESSST